MSQAFCCAEKGARLSHELRPTVLGDLGLKPALEFPAEGVSKRTKQRITVEGFKSERLSASIETALCGIVQEALNNAAKHARATRVTICFDARRAPSSVRFWTTKLALISPACERERQTRSRPDRDSRKAPRPGWNVREIKSTTGRGTDLRVTVPLEEQNDNGPIGR